MDYKQKKIENASIGLAAAIIDLMDAVREPAICRPASNEESMANAAVSAASTVRSTAKSGAASATIKADLTPARRVYVYMAGSRGLATIAETFGSRIVAAVKIDRDPYVVKCGTTTVDLAERMRQIGRDQYGAAIRTSTGLELQTGFAAWISHMISTSRQPFDPAVKLLPRAIAVDLPHGVTRRSFDTSLHAALKSRSLDRVPTRDMPRRFVAYDLVKTRVSATRELYLLSPHDRADGDFLLDAVEGVLTQARTNFADKGAKARM